MTNINFKVFEPVEKERFGDMVRTESHVTSKPVKQSFDIHL